MYLFDGSHLCGVGEAHSLKVEKFLFEGKSDYQDVVVFEVSYTLAYLVYSPEIDGGVWSGCNPEFSMMVFFLQCSAFVVEPFELLFWGVGGDHQVEEVMMFLSLLGMSVF